MKMLTNNGAVLNRTGKEFWAGLANIIDGYIEEVHTYEKAERAGFHHSLYFSPRALNLIKEQEAILFFAFNDGDIDLWIDWDSPDLSDDEAEELKSLIKEQITLR